MPHLFADLDLHIFIMLILALIFTFIYEAINGFHDTSNSVVTVIYTCALKSQTAVALSGLFNFLGVIMGGLSVAYTIVHLFPTDLIINTNNTNVLSMIFSMLFAAILWNLGTWYFGLPSSSSHTLIGTIIGIGIMNAFITNNNITTTLNISQLIKIFLSLMLSPLIGLGLSGIIILLLYHYLNKNNHYIHLTPNQQKNINGKKQPPFWPRILLILSSAGVSFSHGANDGQKGIGIIMLMLIGVAPAGFVVNMNATKIDIKNTNEAINNLQKYYMQYFNIQQITNQNKKALISYNYTNNNQQIDQINNHNNLFHVINKINTANSLLNNIDNYYQLNSEQRINIRCLLMSIADITDKISKMPEITNTDKHILKKLRKNVLNTIEYAPLWIIITVALSLSIGTIIGWKRVAETIGKKIGKTDLTYAQGLSAQITTAIAISLASYTGMPVSTTHVLSSAITGTMIIRGGGIQKKTIKNIIITWVITIPTAVILTSISYWLILQLI